MENVGEWYSEEQLEYLFVKPDENVAPETAQSVLDFAREREKRIFTKVKDVMDEIHKHTIEKKELDKMVAEEKELKELLPTGRNKSNQKSLYIERYR